MSIARASWSAASCLVIIMSQMLQPGIILLKEGTDTSQGTPQLISNINACEMIGATVKTTLGF